MATKTNNAKRGGAPNQGFSGVLYIRADDDLMKAVEQRWRSEREARPGLALSRADVVRELLWARLTDEEGRP